MTISRQEFRVICKRPSGDAPRRRSQFQQEDTRVVYATGRGATIEARMKGAQRAAKQIMGCHGWDRFAAELTIADEELRREELLKQYQQEEEQPVTEEEIMENLQGLREAAGLA